MLNLTNNGKGVKSSRINILSIQSKEEPQKVKIRNIFRSSDAEADDVFSFHYDKSPILSKPLNIILSDYKRTINI